MNGISPSANFPYIFIFTGSSGSLYGYKDRWENKNVFSYTGEGQVGDMKFVRGNLALRDHLKNGNRIFLFKSIGKGFVQFETELESIDFDFFDTKDRDGKNRQGIKFFFKRAGISDYLIPDSLKSVSEAETLYSFKKPNKTEREGLITTRVGQGAYRKSILHRWEYQCAVTHFKDLDILIASHIVPWKDSNDDQRLDVDNGILLSPDYDALFDKHLISFENSGKIILSTQLEKSDFNSLGITGRERITSFSEGNHVYLEKHRDKLPQL